MVGKYYAGGKSLVWRNLWAQISPMYFRIFPVILSPLPTSLHHRRRNAWKQYFTDFLGRRYLFEYLGDSTFQGLQGRRKRCSWKKLWASVGISKWLMWAFASSSQVLRAADFSNSSITALCFLDLGPSWLLLSANGRCKQGALYSLYPILSYWKKQQQQQQLLFS